MSRWHYDSHAIVRVECRREIRGHFDGEDFDGVLLCVRVLSEVVLADDDRRGATVRCRTAYEEDGYTSSENIRSHQHCSFVSGS